VRYSIETLEPISPSEIPQAGGVDLWYYLYENLDDEERFARESNLLAPTEIERRNRLRFARDRRMFVATRALVRSALSRYQDVDPRDWEFRIDDHGKPHLAGPLPKPSLAFNLANTRGLVVCAISSGGRAVGVDAERLNRRQQFARLAERFFADPEVRDFHRHDASQQLDRFFTYWTLKESYMKARGLGISMGLSRFWFRLDKPAIRIEFDDSLDEDPDRWHFANFELGPTFLGAVALESDDAELALRASHIVPAG